jgi:CubicO group peptidase (beta-lactamase class C family)
VGILLADGHGGWTDPASIRGVLPEYWPDGDARRDISLEDLLRMRSGLRFGEDYGGLGSDANRMLWGEGDVVDYAASVPLAHPPGSVWSYSSGSTNLLAAWLHARVAERGGDLRDLARSQLFGPTGMISAVFESDARGTLVASSLVHATARDWARLGLLYLNDGWVEGPRGRVQVLPSGWTRHGRTPTPEAPFGQYGAQIWLNAGVDDTGAGRPWPSLPPDLFVARGYQGQVMAVFPSERLVVVRLGADGEGTGWDLEAFLYTVWQGARTNDVEGAGSSVHAPENEPTREGQS